MTLKARLLAGFAGLLLLVACDNDNSGDDDDAKGIETLGSAFVNMFRTGSNNDPVDAQDINIAPSLTGEPFNPS